MMASCWAMNGTSVSPSPRLREVFFFFFFRRVERMQELEWVGEWCVESWLLGMTGLLLSWNHGSCTIPPGREEVLLYTTPHTWFCSSCDSTHWLTKRWHKGRLVGKRKRVRERGEGDESRQWGQWPWTNCIISMGEHVIMKPKPNGRNNKKHLRPKRC